MRDINPDPYGPAQRSIRNIPVTHRKHAAPQTPRPHRRRRGRRLLLWLAGFIAVCVATGILVSTVFAGATVHVSPRTATVTPPATLTAQLNAPAGSLPYQLMSVTRSATTTVPASGTKQVSLQASGLVTIYNATKSSQRLIANTRLAAPDGKIYRIHDSIVVPAMSGGTPGSVHATVYADSPGDSYNRSDQTTFTIPGFKGDPRYSAFSAKSEDAISGGFVGTRPAVADADLANAKATLQSQLDAAVRDAAAQQIPAGYAALPGTLSVTFGDMVQSVGDGGTATIAESATASGALIGVADLASALARSVSGYKGEAVALDPSSSLNISVANSSDPKTGSLTLNMSGTANLVWVFDPNAVKVALVGKDKSDFQSVLKSFEPAIDCSQKTPCDASIRPFWASTFPASPDKISVSVRK